MQTPTTLGPIANTTCPSIHGHPMLIPSAPSVVAHALCLALSLPRSKVEMVRPVEVVEQIGDLHLGRRNLHRTSILSAPSRSGGAAPRTTRPDGLAQPPHAAHPHEYAAPDTANPQASQETAATLAQYHPAASSGARRHVAPSSARAAASNNRVASPRRKTAFGKSASSAAKSTAASHRTPPSTTSPTATTAQHTFRSPARARMPSNA